MVGTGGRRKITQGLSERKRKAENDPLFQFIIDNFKEEVERDLERRESQPELPWGTSFRQQLMEAQEEEEFKALLGHLRNLYRNQKPDAELKILAFVRRDRLQTERLAAKHPHLHVRSLAADEADHTDTDYADYL